MSWEDMGIYWAWRSMEECPDDAPTFKYLEYAKIDYPRTGSIPMSICCGVFDDRSYRPLHRKEIAWHESIGGIVTWPSDFSV